MKKQILSTVFSAILSLFLAILLLAGSLCVYADTVVCDPQALVQTGTSSGYTQQLYEEIQYSWENYLSISGVSEPDPIMAVLTPEKVGQDALTYLSDCYTGTANIDTDALRAQLEEKVRDYVTTQLGNNVPDDELEQNITDLLNACIQAYTQAITIPMLPKILKTAHSLRRFTKSGMLVSFGFALLITVFLFLIQRKRKNTLYFAGIATATNAILLMGAVWLTEHNSIIARLPIGESALRTLLTSFLQLLLDKLWLIGIVFLLATLALLFAYLLCILISKLKKKQ